MWDKFSSEEDQDFPIGILMTKRVSRTSKLHEIENIEIILLCSDVYNATFLPEAYLLAFDSFTEYTDFLQV